MQTKLSQSHFKKSNVQKCNDKNPNIKLQAIQHCRIARQGRQTQQKKVQVILRVNSVDSENWPACPPIIASVELTKPSWSVLQQNGRFSIK
jgi:hypothetical protein